MEMEWNDLTTGVAISFSAGTYLIAFCSNIAVAVNYYQMDRHGSRQIEFFPSILVMLAVGQLVSTVLFVLNIPREERPIIAACFFPLLQLCRLLKVIWATFSCAGVARLQSEAKDRLFNVLGASVESGPLIVLQAIAVSSYGNRVTIAMYFSIIASILSASYNNGAAVMSIYKFLRSFRLRMAIGAIAAIYTFSTLWIHIILANWSTDNNKLKSYGMIVVILQGVALWILLGPHDGSWKACSTRRIINTLGYTWVGSTIGPLYIMVSDARNRNELGQWKFWFRLLAIEFANRILDGLFCICAWHVPLSTCPSSNHREPSNSSFMELMMALVPQQQDCAHAKRLHHLEVLIGINILTMLLYVWLDSLGKEWQVDEDVWVDSLGKKWQVDKDAMEEGDTFEATKSSFNNDVIIGELSINLSFNGWENNRMYLHKQFKRSLSHP